jgi:F0F1-type ATP synthase assembly protein I
MHWVSHVPSLTEAASFQTESGPQSSVRRSALHYPASVRDQQPSSGDGRRQAAAWGTALNFVYGFIGFLILGWAAQKWVWPGAAPWPLLIGIGVGLIGGGYRFVRDAMAMNRT